MSTASSSASFEEAPRQEAGPLPRKRGEIGYREDMHEQVEEGHSGSDFPPLPARHPADTDSPPSFTSSDAPTTISTDGAPSADSHSKHSLISFFKLYWGIRLSSLFLFALQLLLLGGTIVGWILTAVLVNKKIQGSSQGQNLQISSSSIFIHVAFVVVVIVELIFLERCLFHLRAQRYCYLHPGEMLPASVRRNSGTSITRGLGMGFAPWNRPPLPTYAAALAQNGYGTGDVEDQLIAAPPPPAYGNTRGSTLLLSGFLRDSLRAQRPPSQGSEMSQHTETGVSQLDERPMSYMDRDGAGAERCDAERSRRLEETLAALEGPSTRQ